MNFSAAFEQKFLNSLFYFAFNLSFQKNGMFSKRNEKMMQRGLNFYSFYSLKLLPGNIFGILSAHFHLLVSSSTENKSITVN